MAPRVSMALALTFAAYIACMSAGYVWDDGVLILRNTALTSPPTVRSVLGSDLWCCSGTPQSGYWRPLTTLSFFADIAAFGFRPAFAHLHSLAWHLVCTWLLGRLVARRHGETRGAIAALVFGVHPVLSEAVLWISARNDLLATAFVLLALVAADRSRPLLVGLASLGAALSKESSFLLPGLVTLWLAAHDGPAGVRARWREVGAACLGLATALGLRQFAALGELTEFHRVPLEDPLAPVYALARLLGWITWPWPLTGTATLYLPRPDALVWVSGLLTLSAAALAAWRQPRLAPALLGFIVLAGAPAAGAMYVFSTVGERYLYLPMVGVASLAAITVPLRRITALAVGAWATAAILVIHLRLPDWVDTLALFEAAVRRAPDSFSWALYGSELAHDHQVAKAVEAFDRSLTARPARRFACIQVARAAAEVMGPERYLEELPTWRAAGCSELPTFEFQVAWSLSELGDRESAREVVRAAGADQDGVAGAIEADAAAWEGDLLGAAWALDAAAEPKRARDRYANLQALGR